MAVTFASLELQTLEQQGELDQPALAALADTLMSALRCRDVLLATTTPRPEQPALHGGAVADAEGPDVPPLA